MIERWRKSSVLVRVVVTGLLFAGFQVVLLLLLGGSSPGGAVIAAVIGGVVYAVGLGLWLRRQERRHGDPTAGVPEDRLREVQRATWRGGAPRDPAVRAMSTQLVERRLQLAVRNRRWTTPIFALFAVLEAWQALDSGARGWWLAAALFAVFLVIATLEPRRLRRRLRLLGGLGTGSSRTAEGEDRTVSAERQS